MKTISTVAALLVLAALAGCNRHDDAMGPAQKAGKAVDDAGAQVAGKLQAQLDKANEAAQQVTRSAEETKEKIKDATEDASRSLDKATEEVGKKVERAGEKIQDAAH